MTDSLLIVAPTPEAAGAMKNTLGIIISGPAPRICWISPSLADRGTGFFTFTLHLLQTDLQYDRKIEL